MKILVINGPNLKMLGKRDKTQYGSFTYDELVSDIMSLGKDYDDEIECFETSYEGAIIDRILGFDGDAVLLNAGALTHYSYAIRDAIDCVQYPVLEIHISNIYEREEWRHRSVIAEVCAKSFVGLGENSYIKAIEYLHEKETVDAN